MIELRFLGTGSLDAKRPKNKLSKDYRRFASLLVGHSLIIDPSEDIFEFAESFSLSGMLDAVTDVLITHSHLDHLSVSAIERLSEKREIRVWATAPVLELLGVIRGVRRVEIVPFSRFEACSFDIIALPASHATENARECALNFLIRGDKNIFYGIDGSFINPYAFKVLREVRLDLCVLDCALGLDGWGAGSVNHNNLDAVKCIREIFLKSGCATDTTRYVISHLPTKKKGSVQEELTDALADDTIRVAYDGYYVTI